MDSAQDRTPRLRDRLREEANRAILAAAEEVFAAEGLHSARMERIASRAGVAVGTLYNHFEDKDALLAALVQSRRDALFAGVDSAIDAAAGRPFAARLTAYVAALLDHATRHGRFLVVLMVQPGEGGAAKRWSPAPVVADLLLRAEGLMRQGLAEGALRPGSESLYATAFVGMVRGVVLTELYRGRGAIQAPVDVGALVELFLRGAGR